MIVNEISLVIQNIISFFQSWRRENHSLFNPSLKISTKLISFSLSWSWAENDLEIGSTKEREFINVKRKK